MTDAELKELLLSLLLGGVAVVIMEKLVSGVKIKGGFLYAIMIGALYGVLKILFQKVFILLALPFVILTLGLFIVLINAFLLWLTNRLLPRFEIRSFGSLVFATLILSLVDFLFNAILHRSALF